jgi:hypothetical protein
MEEGREGGGERARETQGGDDRVVISRKIDDPALCKAIDGLCKVL